MAELTLAHGGANSMKATADADRSNMDAAVSATKLQSDVSLHENTPRLSPGFGDINQGEPSANEVRFR